jgi:methylglutaconyl-CoA hydratase
MQGLKKIMWEGTDHWDKLLRERAEISGKRVLSDFTRKTIEKLSNT